MKILKNRTWQGIQRKLAENEKVIKWWQENHKKCEKTINELDVKLTEKEMECRRTLEKLNRTEERLKLATDPPKEVNLQTKSISPKKPSKK